MGVASKYFSLCYFVALRLELFFAQAAPFPPENSTRKEVTGYVQTAYCHRGASECR